MTGSSQVPDPETMAIDRGRDLAAPVQFCPGGVTVKPAKYVVSRLPETNADHPVWSVTVEASGHGRWAVRNMSNCLAKDGEWEHEPLPSSRTDEWLETVRWDDVGDAIDAAIAAEPHVRWNGLTPPDVLAHHRERGQS
jgi:hypothetical protein